MPVTFEIVNKTELDNLAPGIYDTRVVETDFVAGNPVIRIEFMETLYNRDDPQCLFPMTVSHIWKGQEGE
jgi:hypothetical protein